MTPRVFPILYPATTMQDNMATLRRAGHAIILIGFPWDLLASHEPQAIANHKATLTELAKLGGLDSSELLAVLEDRPHVRVLPDEAQRGLLRILWRYGLLPSFVVPERERADGCVAIAVV